MYEWAEREINNKHLKVASLVKNIFLKKDILNNFSLNKINKAYPVSVEYFRLN